MSGVGTSDLLSDQLEVGQERARREEWTRDVESELVHEVSLGGHVNVSAFANAGIFDEQIDGTDASSIAALLMDCSLAVSSCTNFHGVIECSRLYAVGDQVTEDEKLVILLEVFLRSMM